jgi:hypothetical protein
MPAIEDVIERLENADTAFLRKCNRDADALRALLYAHGATYHDEDLGKVEAITKTTKADIVYSHLESLGVRRIDDILHLFDDDAVLREALGGEHLIEYNESYYRIDE